jgi:hypothetical protein
MRKRPLVSETLRMCGCGCERGPFHPRALVAFVTKHEAGRGVAELVNELIADDLVRMRGKLP